MEVSTVETCQTCVVDGIEYALPRTVQDVVNLVQEAYDSHLKVVVRGSGHSFPLIDQLQTGVTEQAKTDALSPKPEADATSPHPSQTKFVMLSYLNSVDIDHDNGRVRVGAGCHLGYDPFDPSGVSTLENSLLYQLDPVSRSGNRPDLTGWSLPDLGGISHQTIGGFIGTGSSGGSTQFSFEQAIVSLDIVHIGPKTDGSVGAVVSTVERPAPPEPNDRFFAIGFANLGLMGVVVSVTFSRQETFPSAENGFFWAFDIKGQEAITTLEDCAIDLFGPGDGTRPSLQTFLQTTHYTRLLWWPQKDIEAEANSPSPVPTERVVVWQASRIPPQLTGFNAYQEVPYIDSSPTLATLGADILFTAMGQWPTWLENILGSNNQLVPLIETAVHDNKDFLFKQFLDLFVQLDKARKAPDTNKPQFFNDIWWRGLPMDNQMSDRLFPVWFTELWIPIEHTQAVMNDLHTFYRTTAGPDEPDHAGTFCCEIYAAGKSNFWMSPAYQTDVIRIDVFWFANNAGKPETYYQLFWDLLSQYDFRPHWGKYLPAPQSAQGVAYMQQRYPNWQAWMNLRAEMDPTQVFVSDYWRDHLAIPAVN